MSSKFIVKIDDDVPTKSSWLEDPQEFNKQLERKKCELTSKYQQEIDTLIEKVESLTQQVETQKIIIEQLQQNQPIEIENDFLDAENPCPPPSLLSNKSELVKSESIENDSMDIENSSPPPSPLSYKSEPIKSEPIEEDPLVHEVKLKDLRIILKPLTLPYPMTTIQTPKPKKSLHNPLKRKDAVKISSGQGQNSKINKKKVFKSKTAVVKPYSCEFCSKRFRNKGEVAQHERIHTGETPYKCSYENCKRRFKQLSQQQQHERAHRNERPYPCRSCDQTFVQQCHLNQHFLIHLELKPHACPHCHEQFRQASGVQSHVKAVHKPK